MTGKNTDWEFGLKVEGHTATDEPVGDVTLGENGYNYCKQNFSIDKILLKYNDILKTLCCSKLDNYQ